MSKKRVNLSTGGAICSTMCSWSAHKNKIFKKKYQYVAIVLRFVVSFNFEASLCSFLSTYKYCCLYRAS